MGIHHFNGNSRILKWRYCTIFQAIFCGDIPLHRPYIGLIYGRYLQFRILELPLIYLGDNPLLQQNVGEYRDIFRPPLKGKLVGGFHQQRWLISTETDLSKLRNIDWGSHEILKWPTNPGPHRLQVNVPPSTHFDIRVGEFTRLKGGTHIMCFCLYSISISGCVLQILQG